MRPNESLVSVFSRVRTESGVAKQADTRATELATVRACECIVFLGLSARAAFILFLLSEAASYLLL